MKTSKKAVTRVQAVILIVVIVAIVAAGAYLSVGRGPTSRPVPNPDTIVWETIGQPTSVDPAVDYEDRGGNLIQNVYEQLLFFKGGAADQVVPWLAKSWDLSSDGLTDTLHLRSGISFTDGTPFNATAVYFSLMRAIIIDDPSGPAWALDQVVRGAANYSKSYNNAGPSAPNGYGAKYTQGELQDLLNAKPIEIIDPMTVVIHLERPYGGFRFILAFTVSAIVSPTAFIQHWVAPTDGTPYIQGATAGDYDDQFNPWPAEHMVGTGPYVLQSWDKATQTVILTRNENYWGGPDKSVGIAPVKNVVIKGIDDANTKVLDFKSGTTDLAYIPTTGGLMFQFIDKDAWTSQQRLVPLTGDFQANPQCPPTPLFQGKCLWSAFNVNFIGLNQLILGPDRKPQAFQPFQDIRIRKAFTLAFNRTSYLHDVAQDFQLPATQLIPPGMFGYDPTIAPSPYDPATAKQLLLDAGAHPINPNNAFSPAHPQTIQIAYNLGNLVREATATILANTINSMASDTGLFAQVTGMAWPQMIHMEMTKQSNVFLGLWMVDYVDADDFIQPFINTAYGPWIHYNNSEAKNLANEQATISDPAQRAQAISKLEHIVNDEYAYIWTGYIGQWTISRSWIHERPNAAVASNVATFNPAVYGYYYAEIEKGATVASLIEPSFAALLQLPALSPFILKAPTPLSLFSIPSSLG